MEINISLPKKKSLQEYFSPFANKNIANDALGLFLKKAIKFNVEIEYTELSIEDEKFIAFSNSDPRNGIVTSVINTPHINSPAAFLIAMHEMAHVEQANEAFEMVFEKHDTGLWNILYYDKINSFEQEADACLRSIQTGKSIGIDTNDYEDHCKAYCLHYLSKEVSEGKNSVQGSYEQYNAKDSNFPSGVLVDWYGITEDIWQKLTIINSEVLDMDRLHSVLNRNKKSKN